MKKMSFSVAIVVAAMAIFALAFLLPVNESSVVEEQTSVRSLKTPERLETVDLALPSGTLWANMNIGAESPADYGARFMWGRTEEYSEGDSLCGEVVKNWQGNAEYDAATANWGVYWRTPTQEQIEELMEECNWLWATMRKSKGEKHKGFLVSSKVNHEAIFLPLGEGGAAGCYMSCSQPVAEDTLKIDNYDGTVEVRYDLKGRYDIWSVKDLEGVCSLQIKSEESCLHISDYAEGLAIRPVAIETNLGYCR